MKKLSTLFMGLVLLSFAIKPAGLTDAERTMAVDLLQQTEDGVIKAVAGLSEAQLNFKPAPDKWSVAECVKHIAVTEGGLWQMTEGTIKAAPNPEKRAEIKATDDQVVQMIESREHKVKTAPTMEPQNTEYKTMDDALQSFKTNRGKLIEYVKTTNDDLRSHVATLPFGTYDSYQLVLFIAAHSKRHTAQIEEVKADPNFPKN
ncbi:DinB family protein [Panacibacter sp. DH6]|uniref:DinB family protein n=1 Tax=Panacibacter microcysteis TaxID=2793269 RepID=A0A931E408_9BACT|nr:DinB family protein [Panacibacter microcysteis]MBG9376653.1 DinB family protein [Panacibacter microcysteis]